MVIKHWKYFLDIPASGEMRKSHTLTKSITQLKILCIVWVLSMLTATM